VAEEVSNPARLPVSLSFLTNYDDQFTILTCN
jgi:hypothetical protein